MSRKIVGATVTTPLSTAKIEKELKPVRSINGVEPDENGDVKASIDVIDGNEVTFSTDEEIEDMLGKIFSV